MSIRGFRVELGEIESVLRAHPAVSEAVVLSAESHTAYLVAYLLPNQGSPLSVDGLRNFLKAKLPNYMIPAVFVILDSLPLTPTGKVDRKALPAPDLVRPAAGEVFVSPRTPVEKVVAKIWADVLGVDQVGVHDNFFDLGGHSLLATQVSSRVFNRCRVELPLRTLFEKPTVEELAIAITKIQADGAGQDDLAHLLAEMDALSDAEAERLLAEKNR